MTVQTIFINIIEWVGRAIFGTINFIVNFELDTHYSLNDMGQVINFILIVAGVLILGRIVWLKFDKLPNE